MTDIQRWSHRITDTPEGPHVWHDKADGGEWVRYADHVEALQQARAETRYANALVNEQAKRDGYEQGERDMLARCIAAVEALDCWKAPGPVAVEVVLRESVIAAIKGDSDE